MRPVCETFAPPHVSAATHIIRGILGRVFSINSVRIVSTDEIAIEDDDGRDWQITIKGPGR